VIAGVREWLDLVQTPVEQPRAVPLHHLLGQTLQAAPDHGRRGAQNGDDVEAVAERVVDRDDAQPRGRVVAVGQVAQVVQAAQELVVGGVAKRDDVPAQPRCVREEGLVQDRQLGAEPACQPLLADSATPRNAFSVGATIAAVAGAGEDGVEVQRPVA